MKQTLLRAGKLLCAVSGVASLLVHAATFLTTVPFQWCAPGFYFLWSSILCLAWAGHNLRPAAQSPGRSILLLGYVLLTLAYVHQVTGGASNVGIENGQYVTHDELRRVLTEEEYRLFRTLWVRVFTAVVGMIAAFLWMDILRQASPPTTPPSAA